MPTFRELPVDVLAFLLKNNRLKKSALKGSIDDPIDEHGTTVLHESVFYEDLGLVTALLKAKANPNIRDGSGRTPLFLAHGKHPGDMIRALVNHGANIDYTCNGMTFLDYFLRLENDTQSPATQYKLSIWEIENFKFTEKLNELTCSYDDQRIGDVQGGFSAIAEAIYLKESRSLKTNADGSFKVDAKKLKKHAAYTAQLCDLSDLFWQKLLEYGKRVHSCYQESLKPKVPSQYEKDVVRMLSERELRETTLFNLNLAGIVLNNDHTADSKGRAEHEQLAVNYVLSRTADTLYNSACILQPPNPMHENAITQGLSKAARTMASGLASAANNVVPSAGKEESKRGQAKATPPLILSKMAKAKSADKVEVVRGQKLISRERSRSF